MIEEARATCTSGLELARILVVDDDPTSRLTLQTVLKAGGYQVDSAATAAEAVGLLESNEYELVLSDLQMESPEAGLKVIAHAQLMDYQPATALVTAYDDAGEARRRSGSLLVAMQDIPELLGRVANLLAERVSRRLNQQLREVHS
jgi:CheY-like chemotaxis protein